MSARRSRKVAQVAPPVVLSPVLVAELLKRIATSASDAWANLEGTATNAKEAAGLLKIKEAGALADAGLNSITGEWVIGCADEWLETCVVDLREKNGGAS